MAYFDYESHEGFGGHIRTRSRLGERLPSSPDQYQKDRPDAGAKAPQNSPGVATRLAEKLRTHGLTDDSTTKTGTHKIMVHSRDRAALHEFASVLPDVPLVFLTGGPMLDDATLAEVSTWTMGVFADPTSTRTMKFSIPGQHHPVASAQRPSNATLLRSGFSTSASRRSPSRLRQTSPPWQSRLMLYSIARRCIKP